MRLSKHFRKCPAHTRELLCFLREQNLLDFNTGKKSSFQCADETDAIYVNCFAIDFTMSESRLSRSELAKSASLKRKGIVL